MNEVKFRGLNEYYEKGVKREFEYGLFEKSDVSLSAFEKVNKVFIGEVIVLSESISQFTGLKDKNGVDIYHNDRVLVKTLLGFHSELLHEFAMIKKYNSINDVGSHFEGLIKIDLQRGLMFENEKTGYAIPMFSRHKNIKAYQSELEVIGNTYENLY